MGPGRGGGGLETAWAVHHAIGGCDDRSQDCAGIVKPLIKDTPMKEDKPPNKGQTKSTHVYTLDTHHLLKLKRTTSSSLQRTK